MIPYEYDNNDEVSIGFIPSAMRAEIDFDMTNGIEAIEGKSKWTDVAVEDRLEFASALTEVMENWEPSGNNRGQQEFMLLYGGNLVNQAERAVVPIMDEVSERPDYEELLLRFPFLGSWGSPFGGQGVTPETMVPTRAEADALWSRGVSRA